jgi:hypothetical protein
MVKMDSRFVFFVNDPVRACGQLGRLLDFA